MFGQMREAVRWLKFGRDLRRRMEETMQAFSVGDKPNMASGTFRGTLTMALAFALEALQVIVQHYGGTLPEPWFGLVQGAILVLGAVLTLLGYRRAITRRTG